MDDPQQLFHFVQSVIIGVIFSYLLAKLISIVVSFREENISIVRGKLAEKEPVASEPELIGDNAADSSRARDSSVGLEEPLIAGKVDDAAGKIASALLGDSDDDWEGVETTELEEEFSAATAFVAAAAAGRLSKKLSNDVQLQLYGHYKIATEGPCNVPQPSALKMTARAKWQAWNKLGAMPPEEAMEKYIAIVNELYPSWAMGSTSNRERGDNSGVPSGEGKGPMGPVFSTFVYEEESGIELKMDDIHAFAREGDVENLLKCIENGAPVNVKDSEGRTPLHWAVDRGHLNITELLVSKNADVNAKDNEGQSSLHYAAMCEREAIAEYLVKHNADIYLKDNDGTSPGDLCESNWPCLQHAAA